MRKVVKKIFYFIIGLFPKNKNKIVLESHPDFTDSAKAIYDYLQIYGKRKYKFIWLVDNPKKYNKLKLKNTKFINVYKPVSLRYIYHIITSKYLMFGNREIRWVDLNKQIVISLTHGLPFKKSRGLLPSEHTFNYLLSSSDKISPYMADEFIASVDKCIVTGLPRNDILFQKNKEVEELLHGYDKFIIWLPTYKKHKNVDIVDSKKYQDKVIPLFNESDLINLNTKLSKKNILLMLKFHPAQDLSSLKNIELSNIYLWKNEDLEKHNINLYSLLAYSDALITDYSSVGADYLLRDKPLAYVRDDMNEYEKNRGFCFEDIDKMSPGDKINTKEDFVSFIEDIIDNKDKYKRERKKILNFYHKYQNGTSCKVLIDYFNL